MFAYQIGIRWSCNCAALILLGVALPCVSEIKYLGVCFKAGTTIRCVIDYVKSKFYRSVNGLLNKCSVGLNSELICAQLLKSFCLPLLLYASEAGVYTSRDLALFDKLLNYTCGKIFRTYDPGSLESIRNALSLEPIGLSVTRRVELFVNRFQQKHLYFADSLCRLFHLCYAV